jgi:hypothetical protein
LLSVVEPEVPLSPDHALPAAHDVALVVDQVSVAEPLYATVVELAVSATDGRTPTVTVCAAVAPLELLHVNVNVLEAEVSVALA